MLSSAFDYTSFSLAHSLVFSLLCRLVFSFLYCPTSLYGSFFYIHILRLSSLTLSFHIFLAYADQSFSPKPFLLLLFTLLSVHLSPHNFPLLHTFFFDFLYFSILQISIVASYKHISAPLIAAFFNAFFLLILQVQINPLF